MKGDALRPSMLNIRLIAKLSQTMIRRLKVADSKEESRVLILFLDLGLQVDIS
jgi:hypothetical protein